VHDHQLALLPSKVDVYMLLCSATIRMTAGTTLTRETVRKSKKFVQVNGDLL